MLKFCIPVLFILFFYPGFSQQLYFNHLSVNNGLSQGVNNCIFKDSKGFVWISSFDGLNRFDGIDCKRYYADANQKDGLKGTLFLNILEDKAGNLWIGSNEGLNFYNRKTDNFYCFKLNSPAGQEQFCSPFYIDDRKRIWVQSRFDIFIFDPGTAIFERLNSDFLNGNLLVKTIPGQLYQPVKKLLVISSFSPELRVGTFTGNQFNWQSHMLSLGVASVSAMQISVDNKCWIGTSDGLYLLDVTNPVAAVKIKAAGAAYVSALHLDNKAVLWIGTQDQGLLKADTSGNILQRYDNKAGNSFSLSGNHVNYTYIDDNRNLWVGVWGKGVDYTNLDKFHFNQFLSKASTAAFQSDNFIRSITGINKELWCATQSSGVIVLDSNKNIRKVIQSGLPLSVEFLLADGNKVWAATFKGLFEIDAATKLARKVVFVNDAAKNIAAAQFNYISKLQNGDLLLSSNAGLYLVKKSGDQSRLITVKGADSGDVYLTTYAAGATLFVTKAFKGFGVYTIQNDSLLSTQQFPLQATIKCFSDTQDSLLWIGSTVGLIRFNKKSLAISRIYTTRDGLSNQYVYSVVQQGQYLWLSTNAGINRLDVVTNSVKKFTVADGLQSNEFNTYAYHATPAGEILFGGVNGINSFNPAGLSPFKTAPALVLSSIQLNDTLYNSPENTSSIHELKVAYEQNTVGFQFTVIDYVNAAAAHISYRLEGYDKGWVTAANKSYIRYVNLPPGDYTLQVKAFNADGVMAAQLYQLPVTVNAPWWQRWWFRLLSVFTIVAIIAGIIKTYLRQKLQSQRTQLEKELAVEQERIRMARELHDGLGSMLSGIKHSFSAIKKEIPLNTEQQDKFDYTIDKLDDSIKDLRAISHTMFSAELLEEGLEAAIRNYCIGVSTTAGIKISFKNIMPPSSGLKGEQAFHIFRVVQELVQNIIKHSKATEAIVQLSYIDGILAVTVEDNGIGFTVGHYGKDAGIGLKNVEARVKMLHGKTDIQSAPGNGTSVFIEVPVK